MAGAAKIAHVELLGVEGTVMKVTWSDGAIQCFMNVYSLSSHRWNPRRRANARAELMGRLAAHLLSAGPNNAHDGGEASA